MSKHSRLGVLAICGVGVILGVVGIILLGGGKDGNLAPEVKAGEETPAAKPTYYLTETGPKRSANTQDGFEVNIRAGRDVYPSGDAVYYVQSVSLYWQNRLSAADAAALVKLDQQLKGKKKAEGQEVASAVVWFKCTDLDGKEVSLFFSLDDGLWTHAKGGVGITKLVAAFIPALEQALKDVEAMKKVKPSVSW